MKTKACVYGIILPGVVFWCIGCGTETRETPSIIGRTQPPILTPLPSPKPAPTPVWTSPLPIPSTGTSLAGRVFIVDPGHGGKDPGAGETGYSNVPEKTLVLAIAKDVNTLLKAQGAKVVMTRTGDTFIELDERAAMADRNKVDLLISIHADSNRDRTISGASIYISRSALSMSRRIANSIHKSLHSAGIFSRGVRQADFRVIAKHSRPAVLVETGYLTNASDAKLLNTPGYRTKIAKAIVAGITDVLGQGK